MKMKMKTEFEIRQDLNKNAVEDRVRYWGFITPSGAFHDNEYESQDDAEEGAQQWWEDYAYDFEGLKNNEIVEDKMDVVQYYEDDESICERIKIDVVYEHYHDDFTEHSTGGR